MRTAKSAALTLVGSARAVLAFASVAVVLALVAFHGWLLWLRAADGRLLEPAVAFRWTAGGALVLTLAGLRRHGISLVRGRRALVVWLLVALLHWSAAAPAGAARGSAGSGRVADLLLVLPGSAVPFALVLGVLGAAAACSVARTRPTFVLLGRVPAPAASASASGALLLVSPRAPPA
jgi:hypothetical protein